MNSKHQPTKNPHITALKSLLLSFLLVTASCQTQEEAAPTQPLSENAPISYLALGDSYTIGQGVAESERWPNQLGEKLEENGSVVGRIDFVAQSGWTTGDLLNALENRALGKYNLVSLLIGVNNQYQNEPFDIFQAEFDALLEYSFTAAGGRERVFVLSIPDYGVTPFGSYNSAQIALEIDEYNAYIRQRCTEEGVPFVGITDISRQLGDSPGALATDQLHPSGLQYTRWVERVLPIVTDITREE